MRTACGDGGEFADVIAGGEHVALAADQYDPDIGVVLRGFDRIGQRPVHRVVQRVLLVGPRHRQAQNSRVVFDFNMIRH